MQTSQTFGNQNPVRLTQGPEPTYQPAPDLQVVGSGLGSGNFTIRHDIGQSIKSVAITCNNDRVVLGAMRKILFAPITGIFGARQGKLYERNMGCFGQSQSMSSLEVQQIECSPFFNSVVASVSGNSVYIWDLDAPDSQVVSENSLNVLLISLFDLTAILQPRQAHHVAFLESCGREVPRVDMQRRQRDVLGREKRCEGGQDQSQ